jgi:hypothetical protein
MCAQAYAEGLQVPVFVTTSDVDRQLYADIAVILNDHRDVLSAVDEPPAVPIIASLTHHSLIRLLLSIPGAKMGLFRFCLDDLDLRTTELDLALAILADSAARQIFLSTAVPQLCNLRFFENPTVCGGS